MATLVSTVNMAGHRNVISVAVIIWWEMDSEGYRLKSNGFDDS